MSLPNNFYLIVVVGGIKMKKKTFVMLFLLLVLDLIVGVCAYIVILTNDQSFFFNTNIFQSSNGQCVSKQHHVSQCFLNIKNNKVLMLPFML